MDVTCGLGFGDSALNLAETLATFILPLPSRSWENVSSATSKYIESMKKKKEHTQLVLGFQNTSA